MPTRYVVALALLPILPALAEAKSMRGLDTVVRSDGWKKEVSATTASLSDLIEIVSRKVAVEKAMSDDVKASAKHRVTDHEATSARLKVAVASKGTAAGFGTRFQGARMIETARRTRSIIGCDIPEPGSDGCVGRP